MKLVKQGYAECQLATIAMLANVELDNVKQYVEKLTGYPWHIYISTYKACTTDPFPLIQQIYDAYNVKIDLHHLHFNWKNELMPNTAMVPDLSGKGQLLIVWQEGDAHAMAYEDGLVYDPNSAGPKTWEEWLIIDVSLYKRTLKSFRVDKIITQEANDNDKK